MVGERGEQGLFGVEHAGCPGEGSVDDSALDAGEFQDGAAVGCEVAV